MTSSIIRAAVRVRAQRAHPAGGDAARQAERVADRDDEHAHPQSVGVPELRRARHRPVGADHGQVGQRVAADHGDAGRGAVGERRLTLRRPADDVRVGDQVPLGGEHDGRAARRTGAGLDPQRGDARGEGLGDRGDDRGVGVQRVSSVHELLRLRDYA
jgi:hypothetical protein